MKAAILTQTGKPLVVKEGVEIPELQPGQVLVDVAYSGVCASQLMEATGGRGEDKYLPHLLGHEGSGTVVAIGDDVSRVAVGDKVVLGWLKGKGHDVRSCTYKCNGETINSGAVTTFSTSTVVSENRVHKLPEDIPMKLAPLFGCAVPTGAGITCHEVNPQPGTTLAVLGLGGIGLSALLAACMYDDVKIIAIDVNEDKLAKAQSFSEDIISINAAKEDVSAIIFDMTNGVGLDYCIEAAGRISTIEQGYSLIRKNGGLLVFASHPPSGEKISLDPHELISGKQIRGSWGGGGNIDEDMPKFYDWYREGRLKLDKLIDKVYSLDEINEALDDLQKGTVTRPLVDMSIGQE